MKWGILFRLGSWWIGGHWSDHNKRLCVNPVPMVTVWITAEGGETPDSGYGFDIYRSDKHKPKKSITIPSGWDHHMIDEFIKPALAQKASEKIKSDMDKQTVWVEAGNYADRAPELRISLAEPIPTGHGDFWIPIGSPEGKPIGWMRFTFITTMFNSTVFGASEWRPASEPAPAEQDLLPLPVKSVPEGFAPPL